MLSLVFHGGMCCGIKIIYGFHCDPTATYESEPKIEESESVSHDRYGNHVSSKTSFFTDAAPRETTLARFDRYLEFCEKHRPKGLIEVTLAEGYQDKWFPYMKSRGFKLVTKFQNSNSGNVVRVYHKTTGQPKVKKRKTTPRKAVFA